MISQCSVLGEWVTRLVEALGYVGIALLVALETVVPPIPSELVLGLAGFKVARGELSYPLVLVAATAGAVTGATLLYAIGAWFGERRLYGLVRRYGKFVLIDEQDLTRAFDWFTRHGALAVFGCRMIPGLRSLISFPAGVSRMPLILFLVYTAMGSVIWNAVLVAMGMVLGGQWERINGVFQLFSLLVLFTTAVLFALHVKRRWTRGRRARAGETSGRAWWLREGCYTTRALIDRSICRPVGCSFRHDSLTAGTSM